MLLRKIYWLVLLYLLLPAVEAANYTYENCDSVDSKQLSTQLEKTVEEQLRATQPKPEAIEAFISQKWQELSFDTTIATETDKAIATIKNTTGYWKRYGSSWGTDAANQFANQVSASVFQSEAFSAKLNQLTEAYLQHHQSNVEKGAQQASDKAVECLQSFAEGKYGRVLSTHFNQLINTANSLKGANPVAGKNFGGGSAHITAGAGAAIALAGRQLVKALAQKVTQRVTAGVAGRILGSVASKFVPFVGWALAAYDFVASADGALPDIAKTIKSDETRKSVQSELKNTFQNDLFDKSMIKKIADHIYNEWQKFKEHYQQVILLAENSTEFKAILNDIAVNELEKFSNITNALLRVFGQTETIKLATSGDIRKLSNLPESSLEILRFSKNLDVVFKWYALVNEQEPRFNKLVELELFKYKQPQEITSLQLNQLLLLNNKKVVMAIFQLNTQDFEALLSAPQENLDNLAQQLRNQQDWEMVAWYIRHLSDDVEAQRYLLNVFTKHDEAIPSFYSKDARREINDAQNHQARIRVINRIAGVGVWWESFVPSFINPTWFILIAGLIILFVIGNVFNLLALIRKLIVFLAKPFKREKPQPTTGS